MSEDLAQAWLDAKEAEILAVNKRRSLEDALLAALDSDASKEGVQSYEEGGYKIKITPRIDRKVDSEKLQELAAEAGLSDHLSSLFRWKPEIVMAAWKAAAPNITTPLAGAITSKPGRPSFQITKED